MSPALTASRSYFPFSSAVSKDNSNMSGKTIFRSLCKGDDKGAYAAVPRHPQHFTYEPPPQSPSSPRSLFSEKGSTAYEGSTIYEGDRRCPVRHVPTILVHVFVFLAYSALLSVLVIAALRKPDCDMCALYQCKPLKKYSRARLICNSTRTRNRRRESHPNNMAAHLR